MFSCSNPRWTTLRADMRWVTFLPQSDAGLERTVVALGALCVVILLALNGCVTPIDTHGVDAQTAGRCKLQAYQEDQQNASMARHGAIGMAIIQSNENTRRQEIFDACLEAGGVKQ
jgi:hypothetical protein